MSEEGLRERIVQRKSGLETKGLKMNTARLKVPFGCSVKYRTSGVRLSVLWMLVVTVTDHVSFLVD